MMKIKMLINSSSKIISINRFISNNKKVIMMKILKNLIDKYKYLFIKSNMKLSKEINIAILLEIFVFYYI